MSNAAYLLAKLATCEKDVNTLLAQVSTSSFLTESSLLRERLEVFLAELASARLQGTWTTALDTAENTAKTLLHRLESLTTANVICRDNARVLFQEAGQWARHFSTVRMTVATFTITSCTAIVALAGKKDGLATAPDVMLPVAILWSLGVSVFWIFTVETYREIYRQRRSYPVFLMRSLSKSPKNLRLDLASVVIALLCVFAATFASVQAPKDCHPCQIAKWLLLIVSLIGVLFPFCYRRIATR